MIRSLLIANRGEIAVPRHPHRPRARASDGRRLFRGRRNALACARWPTRPCRSARRRRAKAISRRRTDHRGRQQKRAPRRSIPATASSSENADFAEAVIDAGLVWVGPPPDSIRAMGLKDAAKTLMAEAGVPVTPGYHGEDQSVARLKGDRPNDDRLSRADQGGRGRRRQGHAPGRPRPRISPTRSTRCPARGQPPRSATRVLIEKYDRRPRHIEVQVFGDSHGNVVHLFERDCSLQRRHQKVIEEAPAPGMDEATREAVSDAAVRAAKAVNYEGAGTIEFIADASDGPARRPHLVHGDEHAAAGRAPGDRGHHRRRPGRMAAPRRRRRADPA